MRTTRVGLLWSTLALCAALVLGAMTMITRSFLDTQHEQAAAEARADLEERTRLALWRMDAAGSAILLRENQRPSSDYRPNNPMPSLFFGGDPLIKLHFEVRNGMLSSPEVKDSDKLLAPLRHLLAKHGDIAAMLKRAVTAEEAAWQSVPKDASQLKSEINDKPPAVLAQKRHDPSYQADFNTIEKAHRANNRAIQEVAQSTLSNTFTNESPPPAPDAASSDILIEIGSMRPAWIDGELFLLREIKHAQNRDIQGVWLDLAKLREYLLHEISDLLPSASLMPSPGHADDPLVLVSFPFLLERNVHLGLPQPQWNGLLWVGWAAVLLALGAVAVLVQGIIRLSERRASFVSAVTHELRTPLTTFRLYSDMLESGAVKEEKRGQYLRILSREADRLAHLVENVLGFSRIERGSARSHVEETDLEAFFDSQHERWSARLATTGLELVVHPATGLRLRTDITALEHILFNLIDNAAKYAASSNPPHVEISARPVNGGHLIIEVTDHGPGIPAADRKRIFRPFHKSAREAADTQPGVGLGLALSRRLATELGGTLTLADHAPPGARFHLRLHGM